MIVPRIIPKRRIFIIGITLVFCSAIFMTSSSIFISIMSLNSDLYGTGDDIVIIYDTSAQTPFTSSVPQSVNQVLKQHDGVIETSGEILIPVIIKNEPAFVRGVSYSDFSSIYPTTLLQGDSFNDTDKGFVLVGEKIAQRMNLAVGDFLRIGSTIRNQEIRAVVGGIFHSEHDGHNDEVLMSISLARGLSAQQNDFTHVIVKIDRSVTSSEEIFSFVSTLNQVIIRAFRENGTKQLAYWKLTVFDYQDVRIHSRFERRDVYLYLPFGEYSFQASDSTKNSDIVKLDITGNTTLDIQVDPLVFNINIYAHYNGTPAENQFYEVLDVKRNTKASGYTDNYGNSNFSVRVGAYSVRFWEESVKKDYGISVLSQLYRSFNLSEIAIPHAPFNGFGNNSILVDNEGHISLGEIMDQSLYKIDNIGVIPIMNRIYYNLPNGLHNLTVERANDRFSYYLFMVDSDFEVFSPVNISNYAEIEPNTQLNFSMRGVNHKKNIEISINNNEFINFSTLNDLLQFNLTDNYFGPIVIKLQGFSVGNQVISKEFMFYVVENPNPAGIVNQRGEIVLNTNDNILLWHTYYSFVLSVGNDIIDVNENVVQIPNLAPGNHIFNFTSHMNISFYQEFTIVSNYSHLIRIVNNSMINTLDDNINYEEDNIKLDYNPFQFSVSAHSTSYSFIVHPNNSFPTVLNNEKIQYFEITSKLTNTTEIALFTNTAPELEPFTPIISENVYYLLDDGKINSTSPIGEDLTWTFTFINSSISYPSVPTEIYLENQIYLSPGYWTIKVDNSLSSMSWLSYVPLWSDNIDIFENSEIEVDGYHIYVENISLVLLDHHTYYVNNLPYYHEIVGNVSVLYSRNFNTNNITIELPSWIVFSRFTIYHENETASHIYNGSTTISMPSDNYTQKSLLIEFSTFDYYGTSSQYNVTYEYNVPGVNTIINIIDMINITDSYEIYLTSKNTNQHYYYYISTNTLELHLIRGYWDIEVVMKDISFNFVKHTSSYLNLSLMLYNITVYANNTNFDEFRDYTGNIIVENIITGESYYHRYDITHKLALGNSIYKITTISDRTTGSKTVIVDNNNRQVIVNSDIINETGLIKILGGQGIDPETASIRHINTNIIAKLTQIGELWLVENFPIGDVYVTVSQGGFKTEIIGWFEPSIYDVILYLDNSTFSIGDWIGKGGVIQANDASSFGAEAVTGPLAFTKVIIAAEILIILLSLMVNISGVFSGLVSESRNEIKIARSIGFSKLQVLMGILRDLWYVGLLATVIGGLIGMGITTILFDSNSTILFGHRFQPEFTIFLWIIDFISINLIAVIGGIIGLKLEGEFS